jgi:predicted RNA-binding Zn-ribbon protein involved in translation (DUF1610 family)
MKPLILDNKHKTEWEGRTDCKKPEDWKYAVCPKCGGERWRIIFTDTWETSGQCVQCGWMDIVHEG